MLSRKLVSLATAATVVAVVPLSIAVAQDAPKRLVTYADLDLTTPAGQHTLDQRLTSAIRTVCPAPPVTVADEVAAYHECRLVAQRSARAQMATAIAAAEQKKGPVLASR
jgi:UrcA family protein